jgi:tetratricopeptide (TPR) repeat protein
MTTRLQFTVLVATVLAATVLAVCPASLMAQQAAAPVKVDQSAATQRTEADKKLDEIMKGTEGRLDPARLVPQLEQFIRDNPDYPRLQRAYSSLLMFAGMDSSNPERTLALADEALAKYPENPSIRSSAIRAKLLALRAQKKDDAIKELGRKILESETDPVLLQSAAQADKADSLKLLDKAIAERKKNPSPTASPTLSDLTWSYAQSLGQAGRKDEAFKLYMETVEEAKKNIAELEALPKEDPKRAPLTMLRMNLGSRYQTLAKLLADAGDYQKALDYVDLSQQSGGDEPLGGTARYEEVRAGIYAKMGKPELELESYAKSFAVRMDIKTRDKIREVATKNGKKPDEVLERARQIRKQNAVTIKGFELKTLDGPVVTLDSIRSKAKATLVNFFFPT